MRARATANGNETQRGRYGDGIRGCWCFHARLLVRAFFAAHGCNPSSAGLVAVDSTARGKASQHGLTARVVLGTACRNDRGRQRHRCCDRGRLVDTGRPRARHDDCRSGASTLVTNLGQRVRYRIPAGRRVVMAGTGLLNPGRISIDRTVGIELPRVELYWVVLCGDLLGAAAALIRARANTRWTAPRPSISAREAASRLTQESQRRPRPRPHWTPLGRIEGTWLSSGVGLLAIPSLDRPRRI